MPEIGQTKLYSGDFSSLFADWLNMTEGFILPQTFFKGNHEHRNSSIAEKDANISKACL